MARYRCFLLVAALISAVLFGSVGCPKATESGYPAPITPAELAERLGTPAAPLILDVRSPREYAAGHIPTAISIPYPRLSDRLGDLEIDKSDEVVVYCLSGKRSTLSRQKMAQAGYTDVRILEGQFRAWRKGDYPVEQRISLKGGT
jgi:phage shock protein E